MKRLAEPSSPHVPQPPATGAAPAASPLESALALIKAAEARILDAQRSNPTGPPIEEVADADPTRPDRKALDARLDRMELEHERQVQELQSLIAQHEAQSRRLHVLMAQQWREIDRLRGANDGPPARAPGSGSTTLGAAGYAGVATQAEVENLLGQFGMTDPEGVDMATQLFAKAAFQPEFRLRDSGEYDLMDFLTLHDRNFVQAAYLAILRREPDPEGGAEFLHQVRCGESKAHLLHAILTSPEGRKHKTVIRGLETHLRIQRICDLPWIGRLCAAVLFLANIKGHLRDLRAMENHMIRMAEESQAVHEANLSKLRTIGK